MNNLVHIKPLDPIFNEYEAFVDKSAGLKTIAFKYFGADIQKAIEYLDINSIQEPKESESINLSLVNTEYYQPELLH
jgi:cyanate lyase|tara:strand:- start:1004 stop:1234 length:231 start_codon:yes stop_codon:yes gene_type:complete